MRSDPTKWTGNARKGERRILKKMGKPNYSWDLKKEKAKKFKGHWNFLYKLDGFKTNGTKTKKLSEVVNEDREHFEKSGRGLGGLSQNPSKRKKATETVQVLTISLYWGK